MKFSILVLALLAVSTIPLAGAENDGSYPDEMYEIGLYNHTYKVDYINGSVSPETGPVNFTYMVRPYSINIFEFNCSENGSIIVKMIDSDNDSMFWDPFGEGDWIVVNDTTNREVLCSSSDCIYWPTLPGISYHYDSPDHENVTIEISGDGNYTMMVHWRELEEWEKATCTSWTEIFIPWGAWLLSLLFGLLILGSIALLLRFLTKRRIDKSSKLKLKLKEKEHKIKLVPSAFLIAKSRSIRNRMILTALIPLILTLIGTAYYQGYILNHPNDFLDERIGPDNIDDLRARWKALSFDENVYGVSFSIITEEGLLVHTSPDKTELLFSRIDEYKVIHRYGLPGRCSRIDVNEKERLLLACGTNDWSPEGSTFLFKYHFEGNGIPVLSQVPIDLPVANLASFSPSGKYLALNNYWNGSDAGIYRTVDGSKILNLSFIKVSFSPDERYVAWTNTSGSGSIMSFPDGEHICTLDGFFLDSYHERFSWSPNSSLLAVLNNYGAQILEVGTFKAMNTIACPENKWNSIISYTPDGQMLLIGYDGYCSDDESGYAEIVIMDALGMNTYKRIQEWSRGPDPYWSEPREGLCMGEFPEYLQIIWKPDQSGFIVSSREYVVGGDLIHYAVGKVVIDDKVLITSFVPSFLSFMLIGGPIWIGLLRSPASMVRSLAQRKGISLLFLTCSIVTVILTGLSFHQTGAVKGWQYTFSSIDQANNLLISLIFSFLAVVIFSLIVYLPGRKNRNFKEFIFALSIFIGFFCMLMIGIGIVESTMSALFPDVFRVKTLSWEFDVADLAYYFNPWATHSIMTFNYYYYGNTIVLPIWTVISTAVLLIPTLALFRSFRSGLAMGRIRSGIGIALFTIGPVAYWFLSFIFLDRLFWEHLFPMTGYGENMSVIVWYPNRYYIQNPFGSALLIFTLVGFLFIGFGTVLSLLPKGSFIVAKIDSPEKLSQRTRLLILEHLKKSPGSGIDDMVRELNVSRGNMRYHLDILEKNGEVDAFVDGFRKKYDLRSKGIPEGMDDFNLIRGAIEEFPGIDQAELARLLGWSRSAVNRIVLELLSRGKILRMKDGKVWKYFSSKSNE